MFMKIFPILCCAILLFSCKKNDAGKGSWASWTVGDTPIFKGQYPLVGDPSVLKDGSIYRMFYTGFDAFRSPQGPEICQAVSTDGIHWTNVKVNDSIEGRMLYTGSNAWSNAHETSLIWRSGDKYLLYFIGYRDTGKGFFGADTVSIGLAESGDGEHFTQAQQTPVMKSSPDGLDRSALSSPSIINWHDSLLMIYTGFCYAGCGAAVTSSLLAAASADGVTWVKRPMPIISKEEIPWAPAGVAESAMVTGPDGMYYLFMTSVDDPHVIGVARSATPLGPWDVDPRPIIEAGRSFSTKGAVAPSVVIEGSRVRLWYHGFTADKIQIGYAESAWPLKD